MLRGAIALYNIQDRILTQPDPDLAHLSPLGWEHVNLTGDFRWETSPTLEPDQFRPLRSSVQNVAATP